MAALGSESNADFTSDTYTVANGSYSHLAVLGGTVVSSEVVELNANSYSQIAVVNGNEGDLFSKGSILIEFDQRALQTQRASAYDQIMQTSEMLRYAQANSQTLSTEQRTIVNNAQYQLNQAQTQLRFIESQLQNLNVHAPFNGMIISKYVSQGQQAQPHQALLEFSNIGQLQLEVRVPIRLLPQVRIGAFYKVQIDTIRQAVSATVAQIKPVTQDYSHSAVVLLNLPQGVPVLPGSFAEVELPISNDGKPVPMIPNAAISWHASLPSVYVINNANQVGQRFIRLGDSLDERMTLVLTGLGVGEVILNNPKQYLALNLAI
jgi:RND family efflux transporter MFP subunit